MQHNNRTAEEIATGPSEAYDNSTNGLLMMVT